MVISIERHSGDRGRVLEVHPLDRGLERAADVVVVARAERYLASGLVWFLVDHCKLLLWGRAEVPASITANSHRLCDLYGKRHGAVSR